ncbi:hypothetical protein H4218_002679 [Coemansia sp. IMI 209128]|nr:hypothetical protein H4218_002679 [Coemansia sp. IMI 209128]
MSRFASASPSASLATYPTTATIKSETMDKFFSLANPAAQHAQVFSQHDDNNPYILPSFADNFESWAYPETQQAVFEDWIATATPPSTAISSPLLAQQAMLAAAMSPTSFSASSLSPSLSSTTSTNSSPLLTNDLALSLASTLRSATAPVQSTRMVSPGAFSVADYAAALFPDIAASLSSALASPIEPCMAMAPRRTVSAASLQLPSVIDSQLSWTAELAGLFDGTAPSSPSPTPSAAPTDASLACTSAASILLTTSSDPEAEELRKKRDSEFLASLPPQLALKRRRTSNMKQKEKILAELLSDEQTAAVAAAPAARKIAVPKKVKAEFVAPAEPPALVVDDCEASDCEETGSDAAALKRKKNTDAARRSRMRKILRIETLEGRVSELETENARLAQLVASLEADKAAMAAQRASPAASFAL